MTRVAFPVVSAAALLAAVSLFACGDGGTEPRFPDDFPWPTVVTITPATAALHALGATVQLAAEVRDQNGNVMANVAVSWSSGDAAVAAVDATGLVRGVAEGVATITAAAGEARGTSEISVASPDRTALVALFEATDGPNWVNNDGWLTDAPLDTWFGVRVDAQGRVSELSLRYNDLTGTIPPELGNLTNLTKAMLDRNSLFGEIPSEIGNLTNLTRLELWRNNLTGPIPSEIGNLGNLKWLDLQDNLLTGPIPPEIGKLANLTFLWLDFNRLSGSIPPEIGALGNLTTLELLGNNLTGPIPPDIGNLTKLARLILAANNLTGSIPPEIGNLTNLWLLNLSANILTGPIPPEIGKLANLTDLYLYRNGLTGPIPPEIGNLANLWSLWLHTNKLSGPVPSSTVLLDQLGRLRISDNVDLCMPGTSAFSSWLKGIDEVEPARLCNAADKAALEALYQTATGSGWTNSEGWLDTGAVDQWFGVTADSLGRITELDLTNNGLSGSLPSGLGDLAEMVVLRIGGNLLSGRLPLSLSRVGLREFRYADTELCVPSDSAFRTWLSGIGLHEGADIVCAPLSDRDILKLLYNATSGAGWHANHNWLSNAPLQDWFGVYLDDQGRVDALLLNSNNLIGPIPPELGQLTGLRDLRFSSNNLTGPIPSELGNLTSLETLLRLNNNNLTGPIPPELGDLVSLRDLRLAYNNLTGGIPPELGNLANLTRLELHRNELSGAIPPELGNLTRLTHLWLGGNELTGLIPRELGGLASLKTAWLSDNLLSQSIPAELGNLSALTSLLLERNQLSGPIPAELGDLSALTSLLLDRNQLSAPIPAELGNLVSLTDLGLGRNQLTGRIPAELGRMRSLRKLNISFNPGLEGPLPTDLAALGELVTLHAVGTALCAPKEPYFQAWLSTVAGGRVSLCIEGDRATAYLSQAVQSRKFPVPLVAGERALLRVFVTASQATTVDMPEVRARFYRNGIETHMVEIPRKSNPIPTLVDESSLAGSANAEIPGNIIQPGLEMLIEIDPDGTLDPVLGVPTHIPATGRVPLDVRVMPLFDLTLIPFIWEQTQDSTIVNLIESIAADPDNHDMLRGARTLLPIGSVEVTAHEPVLSSSNSTDALLSQTSAIRVMEGGTGHYMGMMSRPIAGPAGIALQAGRSSFSVASPSVITHELGHNLSLPHAPCGNPSNPDPWYPYPDGSIGAWGYDFEDGGQLVHPLTPDLMSYCGPVHISDHHLTKALRFRLTDEETNDLAAVVPMGQSLLLWGGIGVDSVPFLEPAFVVDAPRTLPLSGGDHQLVGRTATGEELFSLSFAMPEVADGDGSSSFAFMLPVRTEWTGKRKLDSITLTGPGGFATLDGDTDRPIAILRNASTGQIRGFIRDLPEAVLTQAAAAVGSSADLMFDVLFSRGVPEPATW